MHGYDRHNSRSRKKISWGHQSRSEQLMANLLSWMLVVRGTVRITYHFYVILTIAAPTPQRTMAHIAAAVV